jgi:hypothetical protein
LVSFARIAVGAHFLSDTVVSFFVMLIMADSVHHYMFEHRARTSSASFCRDDGAQPSGFSDTGSESAGL